jgi:hypothetical protein
MAAASRFDLLALGVAELAVRLQRSVQLVEFPSLDRRGALADPALYDRPVRRVRIHLFVRRGASWWHGRHRNDGLGSVIAKTFGRR